MILLAEIQGFLTSLDIWDVCFILMLAIFLGIEVISNVPAILHTPLMSGANAIQVVIVGSIIVMGHLPGHYFALILGFMAVVSERSTSWVVCSDQRMLRCLRKRNKTDPHPGLNYYQRCNNNMAISDI
jgi:NAD(P) transhydrogenase subunit alpha